MTRTPLENVLDLLDLEPIEVNIFRGVSPQNHLQRVFGGQVLGQALMAAYAWLFPARGRSQSADPL